jgi:hypothetical protein
VSFNQQIVAATLSLIVEQNAKQKTITQTNSIGTQRLSTTLVTFLFNRKKYVGADLTRKVYSSTKLDKTKTNFSFKWPGLTISHIIK